MKFVMTGGGTGGHLYPAIAIAEQIKKVKPDSEIIFLGSKDSIEAEVVPKNGYEFHAVPSRWFYRGNGFFSDMREFVKACSFTIAGIFKSIKLIRKFKPDAVIGTGGFVSVPVIIAGKICGANCYIHEQNAYPGIGNRFTSKYCKKVFLGFEGAEKVFKQKIKTSYTGNPVRAEFTNLDRTESRKKLGIADDDFVVFSFGGSLGSNEINGVAEAYARRIKKGDKRTLIFGTGTRFFDDTKDRLSKATGEEGELIGEAGTSFIVGQIRLFPYIDGMADAISASDLVICRAGALSLAEITACGRASIIIPYPWAADNHQYYNAKVVADCGGGLLFEQADVDVEKLSDLIEELSKDKDRIAKMEAASKKLGQMRASEKIVDEIMEKN